MLLVNQEHEWKPLYENAGVERCAKCGIERKPDGMGKHQYRPAQNSMKWYDVKDDNIMAACSYVQKAAPIPGFLCTICGVIWPQAEKSPCVCGTKRAWTATVINCEKCKGLRAIPTGFGKFGKCPECGK